MRRPIEVEPGRWLLEVTDDGHMLSRVLPDDMLATGIPGAQLRLLGVNAAFEVMDAASEARMQAEVEAFDDDG